MYTKLPLSTSKTSFGYLPSVDHYADAIEQIGTTGTGRICKQQTIQVSSDLFGVRKILHP